MSRLKHIVRRILDVGRFRHHFLLSPRSGVHTTIHPCEPIASRSTAHCIEIIASAYRRPGELKVLVQSIVNQTDSNWILRVFHDGADDAFDDVAASFRYLGDKVRFTASVSRYNDYGHSLREIGLAESTGDYVLITNDDNYYPPSFLAFVNSAIHADDPDVVLIDMIHGHNNPGGRRQLAHNPFITKYRRFDVDMGAAVVRGTLARAAGFKDHTHDGDATYFEDVAKVAGRALRITKVPRVLFVHN